MAETVEIAAWKRRAGTVTAANGTGRLPCSAAAACQAFPEYRTQRAEHPERYNPY